MSTIMSHQQILNDLQDIYVAAMDEKNFAIALKAKELQAKELELYEKKMHFVDLNNLSESDLEKVLEKIDPEGYHVVSQP